MLQRDDWELMLRELKSQRNQLLLQAEMNQACIGRTEHVLTLYPKKKDAKQSKADRKTY